MYAHHHVTNSTIINCNVSVYDVVITLFCAVISGVSYKQYVVVKIHFYLNMNVIFINTPELYIFYMNLVYKF